MSKKNIKPRIFYRSNDPSESELKPIVLDYKALRKKNKKADEDNGKRKYSRGLKDIQEVEADFVRIARRASKAVSKGLDTYDQERTRSANEKKDGALEDFAHNSAKAISASLKEASELPIDIAESISSKNYIKPLRASLRRAAKTLRVFRL